MTERDLIHEGWRLVERRERNIELFGAASFGEALSAIIGPALGMNPLEYLSGDIPRLVAGEKEEGV